MTTHLLRTVERFASKRVLVIGEAMLDSYCFGQSTRLCQEAPVPVVAMQERLDQPGGAANTALNLAALGCQVKLLSVVGADYEGDRLRTLMRQGGVGTDLLAVAHERRTLAKQRIVNGGQLVVRVDQGDTGPVSAAVEGWLRARLDAAFVWADAVVISDYGYGVVTAGLLARLRALQRRFGQLLAVDARDMLRYAPVGATVMKPNYAEALRLLDTSPEPTAAPRATVAAAISRRILERTGARIVAITLDADGALVAERGQRPFRTHARPADQSRTAGAGDTYLAALTLALATGATARLAATIAASAAAIVVTREGTTTCSAAELRRALKRATARNGRAHSGTPLDRTTVGAGEWPVLADGADHVVIPEQARAANISPEDRGSEGAHTDLGNGRATALHQA